MSTLSIGLFTPSEISRGKRVASKSAFWRPAWRWLLAAVCALLLGTTTGRAQNATPIPVTGWNTDLIWEVPPAGQSSYIGVFFDDSYRLTWAESGVITGKTIYGLPSSRLFTSQATSNVPGMGATNTQFQFQPYNGPNCLWFGPSGTGTLTFVTPAKYKRLSVLSSSASAHGNFNWIDVTLNFTDRASVNLALSQVWHGGYSTFPAPDWGGGTGSLRALTVERVGHSSSHVANDADPITGTQGGFAMYEFVIDLTSGNYDLQQYTLSSVFFNKRFGTSDAQSGVFALSGLLNGAVQPPVAPAVTANPVGQTLCEGETATFTAAASGFPTPTVKWQVSTTAGLLYSDIAGATSPTLTFTSAVTQTANFYRAVFSNSAGSATTSGALLVVAPQPLPPTIVAAPPIVVANSAGNQATGPVGASSYAWTISNGTIEGAADGQTLIYTAGAVGQVALGLRVANAAGCTAANSAQVPIFTPPAPPSVTLSPVSQAICDGDGVIFTAGASGYPTPTVQWQLSTGGGAFTDISGATSTTLTFVADLTKSGNQYRARFSNDTGTEDSSAATLTVVAPPEPPTITPLFAITPPNSTGNQAFGPAGATSYQWTITNGTITSGATARQVAFTAGEAGSVQLTLTVGNAANCTAQNSLSLPIEVPVVTGSAPLALTGWNEDLIFEVPAPPGAPSAVSRYFDATGYITWAETGVITGKTINGFPTSRNFVSQAYTDSTSTVPTGTKFQFQPYTGPNAAFLGTGGTVTLTMVTPTKLKSLSILNGSSNPSGFNSVRATLYFTDHAPVNLDRTVNSLGQPVTFDTVDWGVAPYHWAGAITADRVGHSSGLTATAADPISGTQAGFGLAEAKLDLSTGPFDLKNFTISAIAFAKPATGGSTVISIFAVSGEATQPPPTQRFAITGLRSHEGVFAFTVNGLTSGRSYLVQRSEDLVNWLPIGPFSASSNWKNWSESFISPGKIFYRVEEQ